MRRAIPLRPGVAVLLNALDALALPRAVANSTEGVRARAHLCRAGIADRFDAVVTRSDMRNGKPHPESFLRAALLIGVPPFECLALRDSQNGVRAAAAAGMMTIMVPNLLPPTAEMRLLCVGVRDQLGAVVRDLPDAPGDE